ncbi:hypothetical protein GCM10010411_82290 [Actinomadura fulvescens]|uniref:Uncharacterized protein n=1 Tax=Actinomadura fulvescens TaxID=46160 RepID=A0ABN3QP76_9ACTN
MTSMSPSPRPVTDNIVPSGNPTNTAATVIKLSITPPARDGTGHRDRAQGRDLRQPPLSGAPKVTRVHARQGEGGQRQIGDGAAIPGDHVDDTGRPVVGAVPYAAR